MKSGFTFATIIKNTNFLKTSIVKFIQSTAIYQGWAKLSSHIIDYTSSQGVTTQLKREIFDSGDGAAVLMYDDNRKKILLIRQYRIVAQLGGDGDGWLIECCAGMLDKLDPKSAIIKEIREETGYLIADVHFLFEGYGSPGAHMEKIHFFHAPYDPSMQVDAGGGLASEFEDIEIIEIDYKDIRSLVFGRKVIDQKTIVLLLWALERLASSATLADK